MAFHTPFKQLREALNRSGRVLRNPESAPGKTDEELFSDAMADVREIREFRDLTTAPPRKGYAPMKETDSSLEDLRRLVRGETKITLSDTAEYMEWVREGMRQDIARKLHEGLFSVQDYIDLHGMTLPEAEEALTLFFREALRRRLFCIKVIHGRGLRSPKGPVLKEAFRKMLHGQFRKWILAYSSAKDCDGGLGATYVILRGLK